MKPAQASRPAAQPSVDVARAVRAAVAQVLADSGRPEVEVCDESALREQLGLDSLDLALVVVRLEQTLGIDPFRRRGTAVRTVGDLTAAYRHELELDA
jgi:acyl carrier protein